MLSGLKFIPRDQVDKEKDDATNNSRKSRKISGHRKEKAAMKKKHMRYSSSDEDDLEKIKHGSRKKKKWYDSNEDLSSLSEESDSQSDSGHDRKKHKSRKREKKRFDDTSNSEHTSLSKRKSRIRKRDFSSENESLSGSETERSIREGDNHKGGMSRRKEDENVEKDLIDDKKEAQSQNSNSVLRKEMGLEWMLRPKDNSERITTKSSQIEPAEAPVEEIKKDNPRELNPYLKDDGTGYPDEPDGAKAGDRRLLSNAVVGDGGASWRLKALKRSQEQAAREGRKLQEVVEERWGSMGHFAASVASRSVAPIHAHIRAINNRRKGISSEEQKRAVEANDKVEKDHNQKNVKDFWPRNSKMRMPKNNDTLSWGKRGNKKLSTEDSALVSTALSSLNKFSNDGSFMEGFVHEKKDSSGDVVSSSKFDASAELESVSCAYGVIKDVGTAKPAMSANQLAAKAMQLRMKGKHEEAEKLLKEAESIKEKQNIIDKEPRRVQIDGTTSRFIMHDVSARQKRKEDDSDLHLARTIMQNHRYSTSTQADEEYDYDDGPRKKTRKKGGDGNHKSAEITNTANRIMTQQERCQCCFENPTRPKHLIIAIANFTYLSLPQQKPVVAGHCCILTLQHESSTRMVDDNVWDEIRNFKKCLIMMFAKQEKDVVFIETVMGLAQQKRHCMVECIPMPQKIAKQAPVYFKKAIDEAEDEWSQHNAKKLIDTGIKGLRNSIPKNFPYFHVEFGLNRGFVHVIDDEKEFKSSFGLNVIRGMLQLPAEDMHRRRRHDTVEAQNEAAANFARDWEAFDWTKQLA